MKKLNAKKIISLCLVVFVIALMGFVALTPGDDLKVGVNQHCGFYSIETGERVGPCSCFGIWSKGELKIRKPTDMYILMVDNKAYCTGILSITYIN